MKKTLICVVCPNGCEIEVETSENGSVATVTGAMCRRGEMYARQEIEHPCRTIASSVLVEEGDMPLCSVRLTRPVPLERIPDVMGAIRAVRLTAPVALGNIVISDVLGTGSDVIATRAVKRREERD